MSTSNCNDQIYEQPEQKILKYKRPEGAVPINPSSLLFAKLSFWNYENRIDVRRYFVTRHENPQHPEINARLQPGRKGISLSLAEALELVRGLRALLWTTKYCEDSEMLPSEEMIAAATGMTPPRNASDINPQFGLKRTATGSDQLSIYTDTTAGTVHCVSAKEARVTSDQDE